MTSNCRLWNLIRITSTFLFEEFRLQVGYSMVCPFHLTAAWPISAEIIIPSVLVKYIVCMKHMHICHECESNWTQNRTFVCAKPFVTLDVGEKGFTEWIHFTIYIIASLDLYISIFRVSDTFTVRSCRVNVPLQLTQYILNLYVKESTSYTQLIWVWLWHAREITSSFLFLVTVLDQLDLHIYIF